MSSRDVAQGLLLFGGLDLSSPRTHAAGDMHDLWTRLRDETPVVWHPTAEGGFWAVTRHADVTAVYRQSSLYTSTKGNVLATLLAGGDPAGGQMLVVSDGPRTLAIRRRLLQAFRPKALAGIAEEIKVSAQELVRAAVLRGECDFASDVAEHIPLAAICDLMRVPEDDRAQLLRYAKDCLSSDRPDATERDASLARNQILMYFARLAERRKDDIGDDVVGILLGLTREPLALSVQELLLNCYSLLLGGDETSRLSMIGAIKAFAEWPDEWQRLRRGEVSLATAVDEILRWTTPTLHAGRSATADAELGGQRIAEGDIVTAWNIAANFDPREFDDPLRFDVGRKPNRHLTFGHGHHFCLGAQLARIELEAMLEALLETTESFELAGPPRPIYSNFLSGYSSLPVRLRSRVEHRPAKDAAHHDPRIGEGDGALILRLGESESGEVALVGGKAANLAGLAAGHPVPAGFCLSVSAYHRWSAKAVDSPEMITAVTAAYTELGERCGVAEPVVAVRSSAVDEDGASASFAGMFLSCLGVSGIDAVLAAIRRCWASADDPRVLAYRSKAGLETSGGIGVLVQRLVAADTSAVVFSVNPATGARDEIVINASWGLGESIVSGLVTPDLWILGRPALEASSFRRGDKATMTIRCDGGTRQVPVLRTLRRRPSLSPEQVRELAQLALTLEEEMGWPVDLECAYEDGALRLLQCRPITTLDG